MSVADDKLNAHRPSGRLADRVLDGLLPGLRGHHPKLARLVIHGAEVVAWIGFYIAVRALAG